MLKKQTLQDFFESLDLIGPEDIEDYARLLISEDYAPNYTDLAINDPSLADIPDGKMSPEDNRRLGELEDKLEREWWERTGNALLVELMEAYRRTA